MATQVPVPCFRPVFTCENHKLGVLIIVKPYILYKSSISEVFPDLLDIPWLKTRKVSGPGPGTFHFITGFLRFRKCGTVIKRPDINFLGIVPGTVKKCINKKRAEKTQYKRRGKANTNIRMAFCLFMKFSTLERHQ